MAKRLCLSQLTLWCARAAGERDLNCKLARFRRSGCNRRARTASKDRIIVAIIGCLSRSVGRATNRYITQRNPTSSLHLLRVSCSSTDSNAAHSTTLSIAVINMSFIFIRALCGIILHQRVRCLSVCVRVFFCEGEERGIAGGCVLSVFMCLGDCVSVCSFHK